MGERLPVYIGEGAIAQGVAFCRANHRTRFLLVADENTYRALGHAVESEFRAAGFEVSVCCLSGEEVVADEHYLLQVLLKADPEERTFVAAGGGTITDITRFISHRTRSAFLSFPTAPSVDGFASIGAPLVVGGLKRTVICQPPLAILADLPTLRAAPHRLVASGLGDMLGKLTSVADWQLGHLLHGERYEPRIARAYLETAGACAAMAADIGAQTEKGVSTLMAGLVETGFGMLEFGESMPASGGEHHLSHFWEMKALREHGPARLHGAQVGVGAVLIARRYRALAQLDRDQAAACLQWARLPAREEQVAGIRAAYGPVADSIIREQSSFLDMDAAGFDLLRQRILDAWPHVLEIARGVPAPDEMAGWLRAAGAPADGSALGLARGEVELGLAYAHYLRNRFTVNKLWFALGLAPAACDLR